MRAVAIGIVLGVFGAMGLVRAFASELPLVSGLDVPSFALPMVLLILSAGAAAYVPARRAIRVDPLASLRGL